MSKSLNKSMLIGNVGKDPEIRYTGAGVAVASFSLATNESWKDQDGNLQERTEWHNIVVWAKLAEIVQAHVKKGKKVYVEGRIQTRSYDDKNNPGVKRYITEIVASTVIFLDRMNDGQAESEVREQAAAPPSADKEDLPF